MAAAILIVVVLPHTLLGVPAVLASLLLAIVLPGYGFGRALLPRVRGGAERLMVTLSFGLIVPIVIGLCLHVVGVPIDRPLWISLSTVVTALALLAAALRSGRVYPAGTHHRPSEIRPAAAGLLAASVLVLVVAFAVRTTGMSAPDSSFTQFWINEEKRQDVSSIELGVANYEGSIETYRIELNIEGRPPESMVIRLAQGEKWTRPIVWDTREDLEVEATLYRSSDDVVPYRRVSMSLPASG